MVFCNTAQTARDLAARLREMGAARTLEFHSLLHATGRSGTHIHTSHRLYVCM